MSSAASRRRLDALTGVARPGGELFAGLEDNNLGNALFVEPGQHDILTIMGHGEDDIPRVIALTIGYEPATVGPIEVVGGGFAYDIAPFATVLWGVGGASYQADVDVMIGGVMLNLTATSFEVRMHNPLGAAVDSNFPGSRIRASASVGIGNDSRPVFNPARRTILAGTLQPAATAVVVVPPFATAVNLFTTTIGALGALEVRQSLTIANLTTIAATSSALLDIGLNAIPLVQGTRALFITNTGAAVAEGVRAVFTLNI